jgi:OPA family glycerol-3-phosphate transporter-like MFS transporter
MTKLKDRRQVSNLTVLLAVAYMVSYMTRINFGAVVAEMEVSTGISRSMLSMSLTGSFITYGLGQIICGIMGDKVSPKRMITVGLIMTVTMNCLLPICWNPWQMLVVWCINGFAQAFMWPPIVRMMTTLLEPDDYKRTVTKVSWGSSIGTILIYLLSPLVITTVGWRGVFFGAAGLGVAMLLIWNWKAVDVQPSGEKKQTAAPKGSARILFAPVVLCVMIPIVLQGMLRDGVTTWMPSYISETYNLGSSISILTGVLLPVFGIICLQLGTMLYRKWLKNPMLCAGVLFVAAAMCSLTLYFLADKSAVASVVLSAGITGFTHGVNLILICMLPPYFQKYGNISTVSGVLNACTYVGSAISAYGVAILSERVGWNSTIFLWFLAAAVGSAICLGCIKPWAKKFCE